MANPMIAVVNDDTSFLDPMDESLTTEGYQAIICKESNRIYPRVKERQPDAVVLDIRLDHPESGRTTTPRHGMLSFYRICGG